MAFRNFLAVVPQSQVIAYRSGEISSLSPISVHTTTHALVSFLEDEELREAVVLALDGGETFDERLWHPLQTPRLHAADTTAAIGHRLRAALDAYLKAIPEVEWQWFHADIDPILQAFESAATSHGCVISAVEPPFDAERARQSILPFSFEAGSH